MDKDGGEGGRDRDTTGAATPADDLVRFDLASLNQPIDRRPSDLPRLLRWGLSLAWQAAPRELLASMGLALVQGAVVALQLLVMRELLSQFLDLEQGADAVDALPVVIAFVGLVITDGVLSAVQGERSRLLAEHCARHADHLIAAAAAGAELVDFERPGFHDRLMRALVAGGSRPPIVATSIAALAASVFALVGVSLAVVAIEPVILLLLLVAVGPVWLATRGVTRVAYRLTRQMTEIDRRRQYLMVLLTQKKPAQEVRAYGLLGFFRSRHEMLWAQRLEWVRKAARTRVKVQVAGRVANGLLGGLVLVLLVVFVANGRIGVADASVLAGAVLVLGQRAQAAVGSLGQLYESSLFLQDVNDFLEEAASRPALDAAPRTGEWALESIELDDVHFRYPASGRDALNGVSITIHAGELVALVGPNGGGKSTLAKVAAQLYVPTGGEVRWNGSPVALDDRTKIQSEVAVIFQDFERFMFTVRENIELGDVTVQDESRLATALTDAGAAELVAQLPAGQETTLGPEFIGGTDVSVGQWQRIALARAFYRGGSLLILDEPSSALDAEAEAALFVRLRRLWAGRAALVISHRFSTVVGADRIYVLDAGRVVEHGTHRELLELGGMYARLFRLQASAYQDG